MAAAKAAVIFVLATALAHRGGGLAGNERGAAGGLVAVTRNRLAVDDHGGIATGNDGRSAFRAGDFVADTGDLLAVRGGDS